MPLVRDLMIGNPNTVHPDAPLSQVLQLMRSVGCRHLPVLENGSLVGIVSERDVRLAAQVFVRNMEEVQNDEMPEITAREIMETDLITAGSGSTMQEAARQLNANDIGALPVVDNGILIGIVTVYDILDYVIDPSGHRVGSAATG